MTTVDTTSRPDRPHQVVGLQARPPAVAASTTSARGAAIRWPGGSVLDVIERAGRRDRGILIAGHGCYTQMMKLATSTRSSACTAGRRRWPPGSSGSPTPPCSRCKATVTW